VKRCASLTCRAFFYDTSKNHNGRWRSRRCGSRMRVAAHYRRTRAVDQAATGFRDSVRRLIEDIEVSRWESLPSATCEAVP
jgi:hypothetical protein